MVNGEFEPVLGMVGKVDCGVCIWPVLVGAGVVDIVVVPGELALSEHVPFCQVQWDLPGPAQHCNTLHWWQGDEAEIGSRNRLAENHTSVDKQVSPQCQAGGGEG